MPFTPETEAQQIWVNVAEAAEMTGYSRDRMTRIMAQIWKLSEEQHNIQIRKRTSGYDIWLPDLFAYLSEKGHGPHPKRKLTP